MRVMGMQHEQQFQRYHRVLNRTVVVSEPIAVAAACERICPKGVRRGLMTRLSGAGEANCSYGIYRPSPFQ